MVAGLGRMGMGQRMGGMGLPMGCLSHLHGALLPRLPLARLERWSGVRLQLLRARNRLALNIEQRAIR